jgi:hypothetical protein
VLADPLGVDERNVTVGQHGAFVLEFQFGYYIGKGTEKRMRKSIRRIIRDHTEQLLEASYLPAANTEEAYMLEYLLMRSLDQLHLNHDYTKRSTLYNKIWSPGRLIYKSRTKGF